MESKTIEEFHKAYTEAHGKAKAFQEVIHMLDASAAMAKNLTEQKKNPPKPFSI